MVAFNNPDNYLILGADPSGSGKYFIQERKVTSDGNPGEVVTLGDGIGNVNQVAQAYIEDGFDPQKIIINGQPATDVFQKSDELSTKDKKSKNIQDAGKVALLLSNPLIYLGLVTTNPDFGIKVPNNQI